jgi:carbonic anhydrase
MKTSFEQYVATQLAPELATQAKASILLLTCMDYRYAHRIVDVMDRMGLSRKYDMFVLAGAAGGATKRPEWRKVLVDHIETARSIDHPIDRLIIFEHRDCGAYKAFFDVDWEKITPPAEEAEHVKRVSQLISCLKEEIQNLTVEAWLLPRDEDDQLEVVTVVPCTGS